MDRFVTYPLMALMNLLAGGFLAVTTFAFAEDTIRWIGFGVSIGVMLIALAMTYAGFQRHNRGFSILGGLTAVLAAWTVVATSVFDLGLAQWLVFGSGLGHIGLSIFGLMLHEITTERVVHELEVREREKAPRQGLPA